MKSESPASGGESRAPGESYRSKPSSRIRRAIGFAAAARRIAAPPGTGLPMLLTGLLCGVIIAVQCSRPDRRHGEGVEGIPDPAGPVRVLISAAGGSGRIEVGSTDGGDILVSCGIGTYKASSPLAIAAEAGHLSFSCASSPLGGSANLSTESGAPLRIGDRAYAGEVAVSVSAGGSVMAVNRVPMAEYLEGVVGSEMPASWPIEALKSQAVAARTFAVSRIPGRRSDPFDVYDDTRSQVYTGVPAEGHDAVRRAVAETHGLVLEWSGAIIPAFFHSTCGGRTESAAEALGGRYPPPLSGAECGFCGDSKRHSWTVRVTRGEAGSALGLEGVKGIRVAGSTSTGRAGILAVSHAGGETEIPASAFRSALGTSRILSTAFTVDLQGGDFVFAGRGFGHGAGLCQWGARGMALAGMGFREILARYYPGADVVDAGAAR